MRQMGWDEGEALAKTKKALRTEASKGDDADQIKSRQDALEHDVVNEDTQKRREGEDCESILGRPSRNSCRRQQDIPWVMVGWSKFPHKNCIPVAADYCYADVVHQQLNPRLETIWYAALDCMVK
ncbi:uncharacterized protein LOC108951679 [Musa acuminata AAA Group]|uniref:uncharacterized protein LOC108951679 n=1 Tax=Musa acuminata AAA Group TaxID=214697 RepID=UPI0031D6864A